MSVPDWMKESENYQPVKDRSVFIDRTILNMGVALKRFNTKSSYQAKVNPSLILLLIFVTILTVSLSKTILYVYAILALLILRLALFEADIVSTILSNSLKALLFSCVILLPSLFMNGLYPFVFLIIKIFISVTCVSLFNTIYDTSSITSAFRNYKVSNLFIYILDITIKYIVLFSKISEEMLICLKCRVIGKLKQKDKALTSIVGNLFIKGKHESEEMLDAMKCRGFTGEYSSSTQNQFTLFDYLCMIVIVLEIGLFLIL